MANQTENLDYMIALSLAYEEANGDNEDSLHSEDAVADTATDDASISSLVHVDNEKDNDDDDGAIVDNIMNMSIGSNIMSVDDNADDCDASSDSSFVSVHHEDVSTNQSTHDSDGFEFVLNGISSIDELTTEYIGNCSSITDLQHIIHVLNESKSKSSDLIQFARNKLVFLQHGNVGSGQLNSDASLANNDADTNSLQSSSDNEPNRLNNTKSNSHIITAMSQNLEIKLSRPNIRGAIEIHSNDYDFGVGDGRFRIPMKKLTKIFRIRKTSTTDEQNQFQEIVNEECELEYWQKFGRVLVLKDVHSVSVSTLPSVMETESAPTSAPSSNKVTIADLENCCSLPELKEILSKLSQSKAILPGHIQSAKERLKVLHEAFVNDSSDSDDTKENNSDEFGYHYDYDYDDNDDDDGGGSEDDGSNDDKHRDNSYNNDNVGHFDNDASDRCAHALENLFISSDKEDEDDEIMSDVETKGERPLSQAADKEQAQNLYESSKKILSALELRVTRWTPPLSRSNLETPLPAFVKAREVEDRDKFLAMSLAFHEYMPRGCGGNGGDGDGDEDEDDDDDDDDEKRYNLEYIENCNSTKELSDIIYNLHGQIRQHLVKSAKKRLHQISLHS
jgi:hypothetical protein